MAKQAETRKRLILVDGTALVYRAYFAFIRNPLINSKGINTSGVFGFTGSLLKLLREEKADYLACVFDTKAPTFRHKAYAPYKATREKMPDELVEQLPLVHEVVEAFRIPILEQEGYEADDIIGTLAKIGEKQDLDVLIVTGDKDLMQLVSDRVRMISPSRGDGLETIGPNEVEEKLGVRPEKVVDFLGLTGDSSDNIPGVPGVGPKTAQSLLKQYENMETVLGKAGEIKQEKIRKNLEEYADQARLSRDLVTLCTDVPLQMDLEALAVRKMDRGRVIRLFKQLEFNRLLENLAPELGEESKSERDYAILRSFDELNKLADSLEETDCFCIDLETTSLDAVSALIVGFSFALKPGSAVYVPVMAPEKDRRGEILASGDPAGAVLERLRSVFENPEVKKFGQNIKYDMLVLRQYDVDLQGIDFDTMIAAYLINPSARQFNIDALALEYLHEKKIPTRELIGSGKKQCRMDEVPLEKTAEYACEDADVAYRLRGILEPKIQSLEMKSLLQDLEIPLIRVLVEMEHVGVSLDTELLKSMSTDMEKEIRSVECEIYDLAGEKFNINSTQQLGTILYEKLKVHELSGFRRPKKTKTGYATDVSVLETLNGHELPGKILEYRQLMKLKSTYVDALPRLVNVKTGRVHASFNQTVAATGRLSSSDPNLQNIPVRTELGRQIRKAFIPGRPEWVLLSADYSQIELRIMAHLSGDRTLKESFEKDEDVHRRTAAEIFGIDPEQVTDDQRRRAKTINFGVIYGMGAYGLSQRLGIFLEEAQTFINAYFARYPRVNQYIAETIASAYTQGYVTTLLRRRRYLPELKSQNRNIREFGERTAVNTPIQGSAADLIKLAMIRIAEKLRTESWNSRMILQIHDELLFEADPNEVDSLKDWVRAEMEGALELSVPVRVDVGTGRNWLEAH
ncbi:MAG TPA: DNA polymerase I [bacterium]|nr:DNA polymerase I [bacterium]